MIDYSGNIIIFFDETDIDVNVGLSLLWEMYKNLGHGHWINGRDFYALVDDLGGNQEIVLINYALPIESIVELVSQGYRFTYIGNKYSPLLTLPMVSLMNKVISIADAPISALCYGYYVYLQHAAVGNKFDYLPQEYYSTGMANIYNSGFSNRVTTNIVGNDLIRGLNGVMLRSQIGSAVKLTKSLEWRLNSFFNDKVINYV